MNYPERLFDAFMVPLEAAGLRNLRGRLVPMARGRVLEIGAGTGANLPYYNCDQIDHLTLSDVEPASLLRHRSRKICSGNHTVVPADVTVLPFPAASFDTVLVTLVLCSVENQSAALAEIRRVLAPDGRLLLMEHVRPPGRLGRFADRLNPAWYACNGECRINRETAAAAESAGFAFTRLERHGRGAVILGTAQAD